MPETQYIWPALPVRSSRRDLPLAVRGRGRPRGLGKAVDQGSVVLEVVPMQETIPQRGELALKVNGGIRQRSDPCKLIGNIREIVAELSLFYHWASGDLIYTGTPEGVGPADLYR